MSTPKDEDDIEALAQQYAGYSAEQLAQLTKSIDERLDANLGTVTGDAQALSAREIKICEETGCKPEVFVALRARRDGGKMTKVSADVIKRAIEVIAGNSDESAIDVLRDWVGAAASGGAAPSDPADEAASADARSTEQIEDDAPDDGSEGDGAEGVAPSGKPRKASMERGRQILAGARTKPAKVDAAAVARGRRAFK